MVSSAYKYDVREIESNDGSSDFTLTAQDHCHLHGYMTQSGAANARFVYAAIHGSSAHSRYYKPLTRSDIGDFYCIDLRGHGCSGGDRGDTPSGAMLEQDVHQFAAYVAKAAVGKKIIYVGFSAAAGLLAKCARLGLLENVAGYVFIAPFFDPKAPNVLWDSDSEEIQIDLDTIRHIEKSQRLGFQNDSMQRVLYFKFAELQGDPLVVRSYTHRMREAFKAHKDYDEDLKSLRAPVLVVSGEQDTVVSSDKMQEVMRPCQSSRIECFEGVGHFDLLRDPRLGDVIRSWAETTL